jgi:hypothetical protein
MHLTFYSDLIQSYSSLEDKASDFLNKVDSYRSAHSEAKDIVDSVSKDASGILIDHQRY